MLSFTGSLKVFVAVAPCDLRQGFNGLHTAVAQRLGEDPKSGALFVFTNRRHIGKKNWLFVGEADAGQRGAVIYTLIECCRRRGIDPYSYLRQVLTRLPHMTNQQISEVTPETWEKAQKQLPRAA